MIQGPLVKKLIASKMALDAIPAKSETPLADGIGFLKDTGRMVNSARNATIWVENAIKAVRLAPGPNSYRHMDDEEIAAVILDSIAQKKAKATK
jgi:hypothetical protein